MDRFRSKRIFGITAAVLIAVALVIIVSDGGSKKPQDKKDTSSQKATLTGKYLSNEKINLKYPSSWSESDKAASASTDGIILTSPNNMLLTIDTGEVNTQSIFSNVLASVPLKTLGSAYYLDFYNNHSQTGDLAEGACVATQPDTTAVYPLSRNISIANDGSANPVNRVCISYPSDESGNAFESSVSAMQSDPSYKDALGIIRSLSY